MIYPCWRTEKSCGIEKRLALRLWFLGFEVEIVRANGDIWQVELWICHYFIDYRHKHEQKAAI